MTPQELGVDEIWQEYDGWFRVVRLAVRLGKTVRKREFGEHELLLMTEADARQVAQDLALSVQPMTWLLPRNEEWRPTDISRGDASNSTALTERKEG